MNAFSRIFRNGRSVPAVSIPIPQEPKRTPSMSLHDTLVKLATIDDDETAYIVAVSLNADVAIRRTLTGAQPSFGIEDVKRVARSLADHAALSPRQKNSSGESTTGAIGVEAVKAALAEGAEAQSQEA